MDGLDVKNIVPKLRQPILSTATCILLLCVWTNASAAVRGSDLPALGSPSIQALSPAKGERIGSRIIASLRARNMIVNDPLLTEYIRGIGKRLVAHSTANPKEVHYYVINRKALNSFALPGGDIGVFTGMIVVTDNASELASVMAHETAHVALKHVARMAQQTRGMVWSNLAFILAGVIAGAATGNGDFIPAAMGAGAAHMMQQRAGYTRAHEYEADRVGIQILAAAHYDPHAMAAFFEKLQHKRQIYNSNTVLPAYLTHPLPKTRVAEAAERAVDLDKTKVHTSPIYPLMRERARVLQSNQLGKLRDRYHTKIANGEAAAGIVYGYALTLIRLDNPEKAIKSLKPFARAHPDQAPWQLALARAEAASGHEKRALQRLHKAKNRFTNSKAVKLAYASILLRNDKPARMRNYLLSQPQLLGHSSKAQSLLAKGASQQDKFGEAYYRRARSFAMRGAFPQAINQLRSALQTANLNDYNQSRLHALRTQLALKCNRTYGTDACRKAVEQLASSSG